MLLCFEGKCQKSVMLSHIEVLTSLCFLSFEKRRILFSTVHSKSSNKLHNMQETRSLQGVEWPLSKTSSDLSFEYIN